MDTHNEPDIENPSTIQEKPLSQMPEPSNHQTTATGQPNGASLPVIVELNSRTIVAETPPEQLPTTTETTTKMTPHRTMDLTIEELPTLPSRTPATKLEIQETPDIDEFSDDSMEQSPTVMNKSIQTTFKRPRYLTSESEENLNTTQLNLEQRTQPSKHNYSFKDVDKLQNINMDKKRRIISKAMYLQLGDFDPSKEYVMNYSDVKTIRLYQRLTENNIDPETLYLQIHNQLTKQEKPKRTKHT